MLSQSRERKRNTELQAIDGPRHLHGLNSEQRSAVEYGIGDHPAPPPALLIAAGAGTGKTKTLAHRVAHLILNGSDPRRLLLLTFTRRAALEMTRRSQLILTEGARRCCSWHLDVVVASALVGDVSCDRQPPVAAPCRVDRA